MSDLSGQWDGHFDYPSGFGPRTPFLASVDQTGGRISGTIIEPDLYGSAAPASATIEGVVAGDTVDFTKIYRKASSVYDNPVDYVGRVDETGNRITGVWSLLDINGLFEMTRQAAIERTVEREEEAELRR